MFKNLGFVKYQRSEKIITIDKKDLLNKVNFFENLIIFKSKNIFKIYDRVCDHAGGKLISQNNETICPMHKWRFNPETGFYDNGLKKKQLKFLENKNKIKIKIFSHKPEIKKLINKNLKTNVRFFNHAFLNISGEKFSFCTDPWAIGPAFNTGWWLKNPTKKSWRDALNSSNFIYVSHNHPDHLHPLTLSKVNRNTPIIVPNFTSDSTGKYMEELNFKNIFRLDFNVEYNLVGTDLIICIFKSGDFREDSGIYFSNGNFTGLLSVDSNMINFDRLPNVDFYGSSFAGGASGYPLMFENFKPKERINISKKDKNFVKIKNLQDLNKIKPKYFLPYAGFFEEKLKRDTKIKQNNQKNSINDYSDFCKKKDITILNVIKNDHYQFNGNNLQNLGLIQEDYTKDLEPKKYLEFYKNQYSKINLPYIRDYFLKSGFQNNLHLYILLTDDKFKFNFMGFFINFENKKTIFKVIKNFDRKKLLVNKNIKKLVLKVRKESFLNTVYNKLPWEDLSIGFQCKVLRYPNIYNVDFWNYFTNEYTTSKNVRAVIKCSFCSKVTQFFDNNIYA